MNKLYQGDNLTMIPFPDKKYDIIYADPPWGGAGQICRGDDVYVIEDVYPTMPIKEICGLPVSDITADNALLFCWTGGLNLKDTIQVGESWGFVYKTIAFNWYKHRPVKACYTLPETEIVLLFKRGKIPLPRGKRNIRQFLSCNKGGHSVKPLEIQHRITEMFPTQSKIELFARPMEMTKMDGWDYWGNEV